MVDVIGVLEHVERNDHVGTPVREGQPDPEIGDRVGAHREVETDVRHPARRKGAIELTAPAPDVENLSAPDRWEAVDDALGLVCGRDAPHGQQLHVLDDTGAGERRARRSQRDGLGARAGVNHSSKCGRSAASGGAERSRSDRIGSAIGQSIPRSRSFHATAMSSVGSWIASMR